MPTYEYETVPRKTGEKPVRFELYQPITASALTQHPETGEPVRRVVSGGLGIFTESRVPQPGPACSHGACGMPSGGCDLGGAGGCAGGMCGI